MKIVQLISVIILILPIQIMSQDQWISMDGPIYADIQALSMDSQHPDTMYAGTGYGGLFKTVDGGDHWEKIPVPFETIFGIAIDPQNFNRVYAGQHRSQDGGETWIHMDGLISTPGPIAIDPVNTNIIYIGGIYSNNIWKSIDYGENWVTINNGVPTGPGFAIRSIAVNPINPSTLFATTQNAGLLKSVNGGDNWNYLGFYGDGLGDVTISWSDTSTIYLATENGIKKSMDGGLNWQLAGLTEHTLRIVQDLTDSQIIYASTIVDGIFKSVDAGSTWAKIANNLSSRSRRVRSIVVNPANNHQVYIGTGVGVYKSEEVSYHWVQHSSGLDKTQVWDFSTSGGLLYVATSFGLYQYDNNEWIDKGFYSHTTVEVNPGNTQIVFTVIDTDFGQRRLYRSEDSGTNWEFTGLQTPGIIPIRVAPSNHNRIFAGAWRSDDLGVTWDTLSTQFHHSNYGLIAIHPENEDEIYMGNPYGAFKSVDGGMTWDTLGFTDMYGEKYILIDPSNPEILYLGTDSEGIFKTTNGGNDWTMINTGLTSSIITSLGIHPVDTQKLYAGTIGGIFYSDNRGENWHPINDGLPSLNVVSLAVDTLSIYVGFREREGVYKKKISPVAIGNSSYITPSNFHVFNNYPNPFNPSTTIRYELPERSNVTLSIYDIQGRIIQTLVSESKPAGYYETQWNGTDKSGKQVSAGMYFARLQSRDNTQTIKMVHLR